MSGLSLAIVASSIVVLLFAAYGMWKKGYYALGLLVGLAGATVVGLLLVLFTSSPK